jgi:flagellar hook-associated protein 3 FlgL
MQISSKLINQQQVKQFGKLNEGIQGLQERISSGQDISRASDDPVTAVNLSVAKEQSRALAQFQRNVDVTETRLNLTDGTLQESANVLIRMSELATMARNGALDAEGHVAISTEMKQLKEVLIGLANTSDANGVGLFSGYNGASAPFVKASDGSVNYVGNRGQNSLQISENMTVATNIDGASAFMRIETSDGRSSLFDIVDSTINSVLNAAKFQTQATANYKAQVEFELPSRLEKWTLDLSGSAGSANITASINEGGLQTMVDAINAASSATGTTASLDSGGKSMTLLDANNGVITIKNVEIDGITRSTDEVYSYLSFKEIDASGVQTGKTQRMSDNDQLVGASVGDLQKVLDNVSLQRAHVGAQLSKTSTQSDVLGARKLAVEKDVSRMGDTDLAQLITELQAQLTNLNAAQAAFAKIGQQSLFDYLR